MAECRLPIGIRQVGQVTAMVRLWFSIIGALGVMV